MTDITIKGSDFQMINVPKNNKTMLYGKANADLDISVKGAIDELKLRGNIGLLNGTEVTYVMRDSPLELKQPIWSHSYLSMIARLWPTLFL